MRISFARPSEAPLVGTVAVGLGRRRQARAAFAALDPDGRLLGALKQAGFTGDAGEVELFLAPRPPLDALIAVGLGGRKSPGPGRLRRIGGALLDAFDESGAVNALAALDLPPEMAAELAYGVRLKSYRPLRQYRTRLDPDDEDDRPPVLEAVTITTDDPDRAQALFDARDAVAQGVFLARDLTDEPANVLGPDEFVARARQLESLGVEVTVLDETAIAAAGLGLLAAVGRGSARPPRLVLLRWRGCTEPPLVLVGKGITFDSGGITIKADDDEMELMKADMAGAAAVIGAVRAIAGRKACAHVVGVLALAENMPSGRAQRPGDVWVSASGLTVEVIDTDAEGRLVLADALAYAARTLAPRAMVDIATLTGTVEEVLGDFYAGLYANDDRLAKRLLTLGKAEAEPLWRLPITESCDEDIKSDIADLRNCSWGEVPDNDDAARFLWHFVPPDLPWAHIDMAGKEFADEDDPLCPESATGFGVRLFDALAGG
ncbi:leucyl aminopeptidase [Magnetospirillum molischianum]|uniref:Putative cytosol aminopeptidase (Leucine aminopeptidase) (LAP) (Leucyl aminopeptidase) PepA n=1 Tax=Magnetospirillum molischianum DSM 120 TaxID=1150626 RepID=H8FP07_MAGML|nr:leucyl aminopeptidase [Magnetospirillum molischianum]CCG40095.1 Putative cytosol aminopeptidase (Leucine aminopeptidase) (LAP) (Leucyl aminopeptidase) PepA [Magnetospirillum molischianum DSM 120]